jgi:hypothetical protein
MRIFDCGKYRPGAAARTAFAASGQARLLREG